MMTSRVNLHDNINNTSLELQQDLARSTPRQCVTLTHSVPSVHMYYALKTKLQNCSNKWLKEFLELDGLDSLLDSLDQMSGRGFTCFSDAILQIDCLSCVRCILNTNIGLEYFINSDVYTKKLTIAMNCSDTMPKKQVFEMLSVICVYSNIGYLRVMEGLSYVKSECDQVHRFSLIVNDLQKCETAAHKTAILTFINALINSTPDVTERIRLRNDFIGLNLLDVISYIRKSDLDEKVLLQLEVFHERKLSDEESVNTNNNIDYNSPQDLLDQIQARVFGSHRMVNFVNLLQDLLAIETVYTDKSCKLWQTVDRLVHHVIHTMDIQGLDNLQGDLHTLPDTFSLGLQCIYSYQDMVPTLPTQHGSHSVSQKLQGTNSKMPQKSHTTIQNQESHISITPNQHAVKCSAQSIEKCLSGSNLKQGNCGDNFGEYEGNEKSLNEVCGINNVKMMVNESLDGYDNVNVSADTSLDCGLGNGNKLSGTFVSRNINSRAHLSTKGSNIRTCMSSFEESQSSINSSSDSNLQNRTVVIKSSLCENSPLSHPECGINDNTIVISDNQNPISPSELTYFSNMPHQHSDSEESNTSPSNPSLHSNTNTESLSNNHNGDNDSPSSNSSHSNESPPSFNNSNKTYKVSDESKGTAINYNITAEKVCNYNRNKVGSKLEELDTWYKCLKESAGSEFCSDDKESCSENIEKPWKRSNKIGRSLVPSPAHKMMELRWITLPDDRIVGRSTCVWLPPLSEDKLQLDYSRLENMFRVTSPNKSQAVEEVVLLNAACRLKINLFLSRLDCGAEDLVESLQSGDMTLLTLPMIQYLNNIIPSAEEILMLQSYSGPRLELGMAEQFVLLLADIPDYSVLLEGHMVRSEFKVTVLQFNTALHTMMDMAKLILNSSELRWLLQLILRVGNFLNYGMYNGDAAGFKLCSLLHVQEVKAVSLRKTLLDYIIQIAGEDNQNLIHFVKQLLPLEKASSFCMEDMKSNISKLNGKLRFFMKNLSMSSDSIQAMFQPFIESLKKEFECIQQATTELRNLTDEIAEYFCEDETRFNLQDCFKTILTFCKQIRKSHSETSSDNVQSTQVKSTVSSGSVVNVLHKKLKTKLFSLEFGQSAGASSSMMEDKSRVLERMLDQLHRGNYNPCVKSELPTPDDEPTSHPLEMSCIPYDDSPLHKHTGRLVNSTENLLDTPEVLPAYMVGANEAAQGLRLSRSSTLSNVITTCTAQTIKPQQSHLPLASKASYPPSPVRANGAQAGKCLSGTLQRKLFPENNQLAEKNNVNNDKENNINGEVKKRRQLELPSRKTVHRRSRSDLIDSVCVVNKWIEYEKLRCQDTQQDEARAPMAEPESACNLSILNLENQGKFISNKDVADYRHPSDGDTDNVFSVETGPILRRPDSKDNQNRKVEKKSSVGGFFSKIGRAVLKPRNVYSDGDQYTEPRKKSFSSGVDKENVVSMDQMTEEERLANKRFKTEGNTNKVSRFFQRGGLYRSSKMKKKNQNVQQ